MHNYVILIMYIRGVMHEEDAMKSALVESETTSASSECALKI